MFNVLLCTLVQNRQLASSTHWWVNLSYNSTLIHFKNYHYLQKKSPSDHHKALNAALLYSDVCTVDWRCLWWYNLIIRSRCQSFSCGNPFQRFVINCFVPELNKEATKTTQQCIIKTVAAAFLKKVGSFIAAHLLGPAWLQSTSPQ